MRATHDLRMSPSMGGRSSSFWFCEKLERLDVMPLRAMERLMSEMV